jgi:hypothetical protein
MEAQKLLDAAPFAPDVVNVVKQAFAEAWASIGPTIVPDRVDDTRVSLAHALIAGAAAGDHDPESLKTAALNAVKKHPPRVSRSDP